MSIILCSYRHLPLLRSKVPLMFIFLPVVKSGFLDPTSSLSPFVPENRQMLMFASTHMAFATMTSFVKIVCCHLLRKCLLLGMKLRTMMLMWVLEQYFRHMVHSTPDQPISATFNLENRKPRDIEFQKLLFQFAQCLSKGEVARQLVHMFRRLQTINPAISP